MKLKKNIVCLSSIDWDFLWQRHQIFMKQFAEAGWNVYFIENTGFRNPKLRDLARIRERFKHILRKMVNKGYASKVPVNPVPNGIEIITPIMMPPNGIVFRWINRKWLIPRLIRPFGSGNIGTIDVCFVYLPSHTSLEIIDQLEPNTVIFDLVDNFAGHPDCPDDYEQIEQQLLAKSDLVITSSNSLLDSVKCKHKNVHRIHHGVNINLFGSAYDNSENLLDYGVTHGTYRSICFFGAIDDRIDWDALQALQEAGAEVVLIGSSKVGIPIDIPVIGPYNSQQLARVIQKYDAFVIPYKLNCFVNGILPAKIYECMATGKPILISDMPTIKKYEDVVYLCSTPEDYKNTFIRLGQTETEAMRVNRRKIAELQSQENNFMSLMSHVMGVLQGKL